MLVLLQLLLLLVSFITTIIIIIIVIIIRSVLDVGCGTGFIGILARAAGAGSVVLADNEEPALADGIGSPPTPHPQTFSKLVCLIQLS